MGLFSSPTAYASLFRSKKIFGNNKNYLYICITKRNEDVFIMWQEKKHKRLYPIKTEIFGNNKNYLYICIKKTK